MRLQASFYLLSMLFGPLSMHLQCYSSVLALLKIMKAQNAENLHLKSRKPAFLFILYILFFVLLPLSKATSFIDDGNIHFSFPAFNPNMREIEYEADAFSSDNVIQLTTNQRNKALTGSVGRATYYNPMRLWDNSTGNLVLADFITQFSFSIDSFKISPRGDGFAFFLAPNGSKIPPQSEGGSLGLESSDPTNNSQFVAVEFDTFSNPWDPTGMSDHVAIDLNSVRESLNPVRWWWLDTSNAGKVDAFISYNSSTKTLSLFLFDADDFSRKKSSSLSAILDLSKYLPEWVTFGFSGSTGSLFELHNIYSWNFNSSLRVVATNTTAAPIAAPAAATSPVTPPVNTRRKSRTWLWVVLGIVGGIFALLPVLSFVWFFRRMKKYRSNQDFVNIENEMVDGPTAPAATGDASSNTNCSSSSQYIPAHRPIPVPPAKAEANFLALVPVRNDSY